MKVSVIVPIYNVEAYLEACLGSIVKQTLQDIEIILVNDGSTDGSLTIAERFAMNDSRIKLISQKNSGQAAARNVGIREAQGDYIVFIDSDDWIESDMLEVLYHNIEQEKSDFVQCRFEFDNLQKGTKVVYGREFDPLVMYRKEILKDAMMVKNILVAPVIKMYSRKFLIDNSLFFESGIVNEDTLYAIVVASCAKKVSFVNRVFYHAIEREGSTSRASYQRLCSHMIIALDKARVYLEAKGVFGAVEELFKARYVKSVLYNLMQMSQRLPYEEYRNIWQWNMDNSLYKCYNKMSIRKNLPLPHRVMARLSVYPGLFYKSVKLLNLLSFRMH